MERAMVGFFHQVRKLNGVLPPRLKLPGAPK